MQSIILKNIYYSGYELRAAAHLKDDVQEAVTRGIEEGVARVMRKNNFRKKIYAIDQQHRSSDGMLRIYPQGAGKARNTDTEIEGKYPCEVTMILSITRCLSCLFLSFFKDVMRETQLSRDAVVDLLDTSDSTMESSSVRDTKYHSEPHEFWNEDSSSDISGLLKPLTSTVVKSNTATGISRIPRPSVKSSASVSSHEMNDDDDDEASLVTVSESDYNPSSPDSSPSRSSVSSSNLSSTMSSSKSATKIPRGVGSGGAYKLWRP